MLSIMPLAGGCATVAGSYCDIERPIWWDSVTQLDATPPLITRQIVAHNEKWAELCK